MRDDRSILPVSYGFLFPFFSFLFFTFSFLTPVFFPFPPPPPPPPPYPLPLPTPEDFFPTSNLNLWIIHGSLPESTWFRYIHYKSVQKIMMVVEGGGGGVALVTFNSRRPE